MTTTDRPPHLSGCYTSKALAMVIAGRLEAKGLPWSLQECDHIPRACIVIDREDGHPATGTVTPPVWLLWTDYKAVMNLTPPDTCLTCAHAFIECREWYCYLHNRGTHSESHCEHWMEDKRE